MSDVIDFDGDKVLVRVRGVEKTLFACDEIDEIREKIRKADESTPLPQELDQETGLMVPGTHAKGQAFIDILTAHFKEGGLDVRDNVAYAIWNALTKKADEYRDFFENGRSSPSPSDSPRQESSADAKLRERLSTTPDESAPQND